jgi:exonuclease SbcC
MMRSDYAIEEAKTYVEFTFRYQDKEYTIKRNPNYARLSKRKNKDGEVTLTKENAAVELIMPDGRPFLGKLRETNQKIVEIIGLDVNQFTQIAMIAQGEFMKLLHAQSKDRKEIFARIFNTKIYYQIQKELSDRAKNLYRNLEDNLKAIQFELGKVSLCSDSNYLEEWNQKGGYQESAPEAILLLLATIRQEMLEKDTILSTKLTKERESLERVKEQITKGQELNQLFDALEETLQIHTALVEKKEDIHALQKQCFLARKAEQVITKELLYHNTQQRFTEKQLRLQTLKTTVQLMELELKQLLEKRLEAKQEFESKSPLLLTQITRLTDALPGFEKLTIIRNELTTTKQQEEILSSEVAQLFEFITKEKQQLNHLQQHQDDLKSSETALFTLTQQLKDLKVLLDDLNSLQEQVAQLRELETKEQAAKEATRKALMLYQSKSQTYEQLNEAFILEQVGIIASNLKEEEPCPVCGSTSHPKLAIPSKKAVTSQAVEVAKKEREEADEAKNQQSERLQELSNLVAAKKSSLQSLYERVFVEELTEAEDISVNFQKLIHTSDLGSTASQLAVCTGVSVKITQKQSESRKLFADKKEAYKEEEKRKLLYETNQQSIKELTLALENQELKLATSKEAIAKLQIKIATISREEALLLEGLPFDSIEVLQQKLTANRKEVVELEQTKKLAEDCYAKLLETYQQSVGNLESEQKEIVQLTNELSVLLSEYKKAIKEQGFAGEEDYLANKCEAILIEHREKEIKRYELELSKVEANLIIYQKQTLNQHRLVLSDLIDQRKVITESVLALETTEKEYYSIQVNNQSIEVKLKQLIDKRKQVKVEYECMNRLDRTANGKLSGVAGLDFQTYIQRRYFNHIIHEANRRLCVMTSNRFILQCRDFKDLGKQGEVGLDLDVYSLVTDKTRDVKTLSGGESFMAALAMALGMADVMQYTAGKIHLDTMFIDEGFGSLDDESRAQAIRILKELAGENRLVGIRGVAR